MIYLDNSATTPLCAGAKNAIEYAMEHFGNPSSLHFAGEEGAKILLSLIREKREEKWMNVYGKGCCWPFAELSAKQLPYAPRIPDFGRFVVNSL